MLNHNLNEINKFNNLASEWWDENGAFSTLHHINIPRIKFIQDLVELKNHTVADIGCGGGILSESLARLGASITAIDLAPQSIEIAKLHSIESNLEINYQVLDIDSLASTSPHYFDYVTCLEVLEHVPNPATIIMGCNKLLKPGGWAFFSTINRNLKSYLSSIIMGEYILKLIPLGTHEYAKFIKPSELQQLLIQHNFAACHIKGIAYNPINKRAKLVNNVDVNYIIGCRKLDHII